MTQDEIIEMAIQGHASTRDAIKWAMNQAAAKERKEMAEHCVEITRMAVDKAVASAIAAERESLLDVVYGYARSLSWNEDFQADIRARGNK